MDALEFARTKFASELVPFAVRNDKSRLPVVEGWVLDYLIQYGLSERTSLAEKFTELAPANEMKERILERIKNAPFVRN